MPFHLKQTNPTSGSSSPCSYFDFSPPSDNSTFVHSTWVCTQQQSTKEGPYWYILNKYEANVIWPCSNQCSCLLHLLCMVSWKLFLDYCFRDDMMMEVKPALNNKETTQTTVEKQKGSHVPWRWLYPLNKNVLFNSHKVPSGVNY